MKYAFRKGAAEDLGMDEEILPEEDIARSFSTPGVQVLAAFDEDKMIGGAVVVIDENRGINHLDFLYVKVGCQGKKVGQFIWQEIENLFPKTKMWETPLKKMEFPQLYFFSRNYICNRQGMKFQQNL